MEQVEVKECGPGEKFLSLHNNYGWVKYHKIGASVYVSGTFKKESEHLAKQKSI